MISSILTESISNYDRIQDPLIPCLQVTQAFQVIAIRKKKYHIHANRNETQKKIFLII